MNIYLGETGNIVRTWRLTAVWIGSALGEEMTMLNRAGDAEGAAKDACRFTSEVRGILGKRGCNGQ